MQFNTFNKVRIKITTIDAIGQLEQLDCGLCF